MGTEAEATTFRSELDALVKQSKALVQGELALDLAARARDVAAGPGTWAVRYVLLQTARDIAPEGIRERIEIPEQLKVLAEGMLERHREFADVLASSSEMFADAASKAEDMERRSYLQGMSDGYGLASNIARMQSGATVPAD